MTKNSNSQTWHVYIVKCNDDSLYTGITTDINRRLEEHNNQTDNKGAKYTRSRQPVRLVYSENVSSRSAASRREHLIKKLSKKQKLQLISSLKT